MTARGTPEAAAGMFVENACLPDVVSVVADDGLIFFAKGEDDKKAAAAAAVSLC